MKSYKKIFLTIMGVLIVILISLATFAFWRLINKAAEDGLSMFGISNPYAQLGLIIIICVAILILISLFYKKLKIKDILKDIMKL